MREIINKNHKGITLIAFVITIIVLLILAGVAISMLSGDNGILTQAGRASEETKKASEEEAVRLAALSALAVGNGTIEGEKSFKELNTGLEEAGYQGQVSKLPTIIKIGENTYTIEKNGNVILGEVLLPPTEFIDSWNLGYNKEDPTSQTDDIVGYVVNSENYEGYQELIIIGTGKMSIPYIEPSAPSTTPWIIKGYNIKSAVIGEGILDIAENTFSWCSSLISVQIPKTVQEIGVSAFSGCTSLESISISNSVTTIGATAFASCTSLTTITIPSSIVSIGSEAFTFLSNLKEIKYDGSTEQWGKVNLGDNWAGIDGYYASMTVEFVTCTDGNVDI